MKTGAVEGRGRVGSLFIYHSPRRAFPSSARGGVSLGTITGQHKVHLQHRVQNIPHPDKQAFR